MNKYKLLILICFFLITITLPKVTASVNSMNLLGKVIILDSGHGGVDAGATGNQIIEKNLNDVINIANEKSNKRGAFDKKIFSLYTSNHFWQGPW